MPKLRRLSGKEVIVFCEQYNFKISRQKGSHVNLSRVVSESKQVVTIPNHKEIDRGTLHNIFKNSCRLSRKLSLKSSSTQTINPQSGI